MQTRANTPDSSPIDPPWAVTLAMLVATIVYALVRREVVLCSLSGVLLLTVKFSGVKVPRADLVLWPLRLALYTAIFMTTSRETATASAIYETTIIHPLAFMCMFECAMQYARTPQSPGLRNAFCVFLGAVVFIASSKSFDSRLMYFTPPYFVALLFALRSIRTRAAPQRVYHAGPLIWRTFALVCVLGFGISVSAAMNAYKDELSQPFFALASPDNNPLATIGFSETANLGANQNVVRSMVRVLRINGQLKDPHLRGLVFENYRYGSWDPAGTLRKYQPVSTDLLKPDSARSRVRFTRLEDKITHLFVPVTCAGIALDEPGDVGIERDFGRSLNLPLDGPLTYYCFLAEKPPDRGPLDLTPNHGELQRCLTLPERLDPRIKGLAREIAGETTDRAKLIAAVHDYLTTNHTYSLTTEVSGRDPIAAFLLQKRSGHCEFFATATVLLLRCLDVPCRYVTGFYAHEYAGKDTTVVRQQDAHAWAEAWLEGKGWVAVDATPASGMPNRTGESASMWRYIWDWLTDVASATFRGIKQLTPIEFAAMALPLVVILIWLLWRRLRTRRKKSAAASLVYAMPSESLDNVAQRFEILLARRSQACPDHLTWDEHLRRIAEDPHHVHSLNLTVAQQFISEYSRIRFGAPEDIEAVSKLNQRLSQL
jgi:hypothetical protein